MFNSFPQKTIFLKLHQGKTKKYQIKVTLSEFKIEFSSSIKIKSSHIKYLSWFYVINCFSNGSTDYGTENDFFTFSFFYTPNSKKLYYDIGELKFSLDYDCAQEAEFSNAADFCQIINQYLTPSNIDSQKPYLLLINPRSGTRKGLKIFNNCISKVFTKLNIPHELLMTEKALHAKDFIKSCDSLEKYRGLVTISGDGLIFEVFSGVMERDSWKEDLCSIPIGVIPAGSGNGLAASISALSGINPKNNIVLFHCLLLRNPSIQALDLMKVQISSGNIFPSFLSLTWGLMAHVDVGSDKFRWMGHTRFSVVAAIQVAKMNKYKGKLWYLPVLAEHGSQAENIEEIYSNKNKETISFSNNNFRYLPDISEPITTSNNWVLLDQNFVTVIISLLPFLATDAKIAPDAKMDDGKIHIIIINPEITRLELIDAITKLEDGEHFSCKAISYIECVAFRLLPECAKCYMAIDGEYIENTVIQAEMMPSAAKTFTGPSIERDPILR